jgi:hypothetical protein
MCEEYFYDPAYGNPELKRKGVVRMCEPIKKKKKKKIKKPTAESS